MFPPRETPKPSPAQLATFPVRVQRRLLISDQTASARLEASRPVFARHIDKLNGLARLVQEQPMSVRSRMRKLQDLASLWASNFSEQAACRKGCSHCCHIPVLISALEAQVIGQAIGRVPAQPALAFKPRQKPGYDNPCTFLRDGQCTIYESRPVVCRLQVNLDEDALLCELVEGADIPVPYANSFDLQLLYAKISGPQGLADVREFFPSQSGPTDATL